jgi:hypothetical protein
LQTMLLAARHSYVARKSQEKAKEVRCPVHASS